MIELMEAGGLLMWPILLCSVGAVAIILERLWVLRERQVAPRGLPEQIWRWAQAGGLTAQRLAEIRDGSPLGRILAAGLANRSHSREVMKEAIEDAGRQVVHRLERNLNVLGTIASISPLLGLLGTVFGMIDVFDVIVQAGLGKPGVLAGGISKALLTTAAGLSVAIPALVGYHFLNGRVDRLVMLMEEDAVRMVEVMHGERERVE